jgi:hypothetical protein
VRVLLLLLGVFLNLPAHLSLFCQAPTKENSSQSTTLDPSTTPQAPTKENSSQSTTLDPSTTSPAPQDTTLALTTVGARAAAANPPKPTTTVVLSLAQPDTRYAGGEGKIPWQDMYLYIAKDDGSQLEFKEVGVFP